MPLPKFSVGNSPFNVKGVVYRGVLRSLEETPGATSIFHRALESDELRAFFSQQFLATRWYDVFPMLALTTASARALGKTESDAIRSLTRLNAARDISGVYRMLLKLASPSLLAGKLPRLTNTLFDFGGAHVIHSEEGQARVVRTGLPEALSNWYAIATSEYVRYTLESCGAKNPVCRCTTVADDGKAHGVNLVSLSFELSW